MKQVTYHTYQKENKIKEAALPQEIRQQIAALDDMIDVFNNMEDDDPELDAYETKLHALSDNIVENVKKHINEDAAAKAAEAEKEAKAKEAGEKQTPPTASAPPQPKPTETKPSENPTHASGSWGDVDDIMGM
jgi:peptidoglycan hydrolase CwlO-like protein